MWKFSVLLLFVCLNLCLADDLTNVARRRKKHHYGFHHLHHRYLYYLTFLAIKVKLALIVGFAITAMVFFGKMFTLIKYSALFFKNRDCPESKEKVIVEQVPFYHDHHSSGPPISFDRNYYEEYPYPPSKGGRSMSDKIMDNIYYIKDMIKRVDLTDAAFDQMNIKKNDCRKRFVCEVDQKAKKNSLFGVGLYLFSDMGLEKYRSNMTAQSLQECSRIYKECPEIFEKL